MMEEKKQTNKEQEQKKESKPEVKKEDSESVKALKKKLDDLSNSTRKKKAQASNKPDKAILNLKDKLIEVQKESLDRLRRERKLSKVWLFEFN